MKLNEQEQKEWEFKKAYRGYRDYTHAFFESENYIKFIHLLMNKVQTSKDPRLNIHPCRFSDVLKGGKYIVEKHTKDIDTRVIYSNMDELEADLVYYFGENPQKEAYKKLYDYIHNKCNMINVYDIKPTYERKSGLTNGYCGETWLFDRTDDNLDFYRKLPIITREIHLEGPCDDTPTTTYIHEMYHALMNRNKGSMENILNNEFLSIFMQLVGAYELDASEKLLDLNIIKRFIYTKHSVCNKEMTTFDKGELENIIQAEGYILSTLEALALFNTYIKGTNNTKNKIDEDICSVLIGEKPIENVIDKYEATPEKGMIQTKKYLKKLF